LGLGDPNNSFITDYDDYDDPSNSIITDYDDYGERSSHKSLRLPDVDDRVLGSTVSRCSCGSSYGVTDEDDAPVGAIVGGVVGGTLFLAAAVIVAVMWKSGRLEACKCRKNTKPGSVASPEGVRYPRSASSPSEDRGDGGGTGVRYPRATNVPSENPGDGGGSGLRYPRTTAAVPSVNSDGGSGARYPRGV
ncbi:unnamed protein product, partial [Ectocarpus sp. 8 AP-2014]